MGQPLPRNRNHRKPYDRYAAEGTKGDPDDTARYTLQPGEQFLRPWLRVPGGPAFVWPLGVEGWNMTIDPQLGIHHFMGDNFVEVDVVHLGEERIRMTGLFPGFTSVHTYRALRDVVLHRTPRQGKVLYIPHILSYSRRVVCGHTEFDHPETEAGGWDLSYSIEFVIIGYEGKEDEPPLEDPVPQPSPGPRKGQGQRVFVVNATINTLRKIARAKLGNANKWRSIYNKNADWFHERNIPVHRAPDYRLPIGTRMYY